MMTRTSSPSLIRPLFRDTALQVALLAGQPVIADAALWRARCDELVEALQLRLKDAGLSPALVSEISHAQCALLDESALRALPEGQRDGWAAEPLQVRFFQSYNAGETVFEQIEKLLRQTTPDPALVETYLIILGLGFLGRYRSEDEPDRKRTVQALQHFDPVPHAQPALLIKAGSNAWFSAWRGLSPFMWLLLAIAVVVMLSVTLNHWLDAQIATMIFPGKG